MKFNLVKVLSDQEAGEVLGYFYFERFAKKLGWSFEKFAKEYGGYLTGEQKLKSLQTSFDMLTELVSLSFSLYKWSVLLVNLKASIFSDLIFAIEIDGVDFFVQERNGVFSLGATNGQNQIFVAKAAKSQIAEILLFLFQKNPKVKMLELESYSEKFDGSYLSFNQDLAIKRADYINFIDAEFLGYQKRLKKLQDVFLQNF